MQELREIQEDLQEANKPFMVEIFDA